MCHLLHRPRNSVQYIYMYLHHNHGKKSGTDQSTCGVHLPYCVTLPLSALPLISAGSSADLFVTIWFIQSVHVSCTHYLIPFDTPTLHPHYPPKQVPPPSFHAHIKSHKLLRWSTTLITIHLQCTGSYIINKREQNAEEGFFSSPRMRLGCFSMSLSNFRENVSKGYNKILSLQIQLYPSYNLEAPK